MKEKIRPILFVFLLFFSTQIVCSQKYEPIDLPKNMISIEIAGNAFLFGSLNYERMFKLSGRFYISGRTGVGAFYFIDVTTINVPIMANVIYNIVHILSVEAGFGTTLFYKNVPDKPQDSGLDPIITGFLGMRLQHPVSGFCFRVGFTPLYETMKRGHNMFSTDFIPWGGFSFGYSF
jgi:hypothetical protein